MARYAWTITKDHLTEPGDDPADSSVGVSGPGNARQELLDLLAAGKGHTFRMYDDDGILYVTGRIITTRPEHMDDEDICNAPLADYGWGGLGAVSVTYPGHPEWDCG